MHNGVLAAGESLSDNDMLLNGDKWYCVDGTMKVIETEAFMISVMMD